MADGFKSNYLKSVHLSSYCSHYVKKGWLLPDGQKWAVQVVVNEHIIASYNTAINIMYYIT